MGAPGSLAERGARLLAASIDELILLAISLPMVFGAVPAIIAMVFGRDRSRIDRYRPTCCARWSRVREPSSPSSR